MTMKEWWLSSQDFALVKGRRVGDVLIPEDGELALVYNLPSGWAQWDTAVVHLKAEGACRPEVRLGLCTKHGEGPRLSFHYRILPGCEVQVPFSLAQRALAADFAFLPPWPGVFKGGVDGRPVRPEDICALRLTLRGRGLERVALKGIRITNNWTPQPVASSPLIDSLGQRKAGHWQQKTQSLSELSDFFQKELAWARGSNHYPDGWSAYGGWTEKRFPATGWFRTAHDGRRWWLVDPEGCAFFSNGMCYGNRTGIYGMADHLESLHEWMPPKEGLMNRAWTTGDQIPQYVVRNGLENARTRELVNFARANMMRVFGEDWLDAWITINAARMRTWGINTLGVGVNDYGDEPTAEFLEKAKIPYAITFKYFPLTRQRIFRDFPDVFSQEYARKAAEMARCELAAYKDDPYLIGYFVTNEPEWLMHEDVNLAECLLAAEGCAASRQAFIGRLKAQYADIAALNAAWQTDFAGFGALMSPWRQDGQWTDAAQADLADFHRALVEEYGRVVSEALKAVDPNHLNLGMRYNRASEKTLGGPLNYFDVFSFNHYGAEPASSAAALARRTNQPMIVGEWHIGARDSGLDAWGLYYTGTQAQRAQAISHYLEQSTQAPHLTGIHYFEYGDQPYLGRFDGECYNIGLIDVCNRPYPLVAEAFRAFAQRMYPMLDGQIAPAAASVQLENIWQAN